jgi:hypothetical protein
LVMGCAEGFWHVRHLLDVVVLSNAFCWHCHCVSQPVSYCAHCQPSWLRIRPAWYLQLSTSGRHSAALPAPVLHTAHRLVVAIWSDCVCTLAAIFAAAAAGCNDCRMHLFNCIQQVVEIVCQHGYVTAPVSEW